MTRLLLSILCLIFILPAVADAKGVVKKGQMIPHELNLQDQNGKMRSFSDLTGSKGIVLIFVRSVDWCPYCQKQLIDLDNNTQRFSDWGYNLVSVSYDSTEAMRKFVVNNKPAMTMLSDPRSDSIRAFGILNESVAKGTLSYGVPYPGVYVIGKDKKVQAKFFEEGYKERPSVEEILNKIEALNPPELPPMTMESMGSDPILPGEEFVEIPQEALPPIVLPELVEGEDILIPVEDSFQPVEDIIQNNQEMGEVLEGPAEIIEEIVPEALVEEPVGQESVEILQDDFLNDIPQPDIPEMVPEEMPELHNKDIGEDGSFNLM